MSVKKIFKNEYDFIVNSYREGRGYLYKNKRDILDDLNNGEVESETDYFIYVDLRHFMTYIYRKNKEKWNIEKSCICSIGKPATPTIIGKYKVELKGDYFGVNHGYKCLYYTQIEKNYLFHSIIYNLDGSIRDGRLGMAISDGCIRLATANSKWILNNVPTNSTILIK
ncbi:MAG: L,D-transpeptidase [Sarcina sp.]